MNLNEARATEGVPVLADDDSVVVDSHVDRINNKTGGNDSDEETTVAKELEHLKEAVMSTENKNGDKAEVTFDTIGESIVGSAV